MVTAALGCRYPTRYGFQSGVLKPAKPLASGGLVPRQLSSRGAANVVTEDVSSWTSDSSNVARRKREAKKGGDSMVLDGESAGIVKHGGS